MDDRRRQQHAPAAIGRIAIQPAGAGFGGDPKKSRQFLAAGDIRGALDAPHRPGEFIGGAIDHGDIPREARAARRADTRSRQHHRAIAIRQRRGGLQHGRAAGAVADQTDIARIHHRQSAQKPQPVQPSGPVGHRPPIAVAVAGLVERQHGIAAPGQFMRQTSLRNAAAQIVVHRQNTRRLVVQGRPRRQIQPRAKAQPIAARKAQVPHPDATDRLHEMRKRRPGQDEYPADQEQAQAALLHPAQAPSGLTHLHATRAETVAGRSV